MFISKKPISKDGLRKLLEEKTRLEKEIEIIRRLAGQALATDGWHENGEFEGANQKYEVLLVMYADIVNLIKSSEIVEPKDAKVNKTVGFGNTVELKINGKKLKYKILGESEADVKNHVISIDSPLAKCIFGKKTGDKSVFNNNSSNVEVEILNIL